ncbi:MAG: HU family DNA-binding protein, partial [Deltaproteobacteria bacterium]
MNRSDLVNVLKDEVSLSRKFAEKIVDTFFESIQDTLVKGERVEIRGFGS